MTCAKPVTAKLCNKKTEIRDGNARLTVKTHTKVINRNYETAQEPQRHLNLESNRQRFTAFKI